VNLYIYKGEIKLGKLDWKQQLTLKYKLTL
jgi:hypothetical protein